MARLQGMRGVLTTRGAAFLSAGLVLTACGILLGQRDLTRIGLLLVALLVISTLLGRRHSLMLTVQRSASPPRVSVNELALVTMTVANPEGIRSPVVLAEEQLDYALGDRPRFVIPAMDPHERRTMQYAVRAHSRGLHRLGPLAVRVKDPFGLTTRGSAIGSSDTLLVLPQVHELGLSRALGRGIGSDGTIPHRVALHGEDDQSIREYRDGDDLRRIHWPATARTGDIMVRQEDRPARRQALLLLDTRAVAHAGTGRASSFEWAVSMTASMAAHLDGNGYTLELVTSGPSGTRRDSTLDDVLDTLARIEPGGQKEVEHLLQGIGSEAAGGGAVLAVTGALPDDLAHALASTRQPGSSGMALVIDRGAFSHASTRHEAEADPVATAAALSAAGWSALVVAPGLTPAHAWSVVTGSRAFAGAP